LYRLQVEHDGQSVSPAGAVAFLHVPRAKRNASAELRTSGTAPLDATSCHGLDIDTAEARPRFAFRTADGRWVYSASGSTGTVQVDPPPKLLTAPTVNFGTGGWTTCRDVNGDYRSAMRNTGIGVARIVVDKFRGLYSLNRETVAGSPIVEPSVSIWAPSTPPGAPKPR
jgi:hypothetical protein